MIYLRFEFFAETQAAVGRIRHDVLKQMGTTCLRQPLSWMHSICSRLSHDRSHLSSIEHAFFSDERNEQKISLILVDVTHNK